MFYKKWKKGKAPIILLKLPLSFIIEKGNKNKSAKVTISF